MLHLPFINNSGFIFSFENLNKNGILFFLRDLAELKIRHITQNASKQPWLNFPPLPVFCLYTNNDIPLQLLLTAPVSSSLGPTSFIQSMVIPHSHGIPDRHWTLNIHNRTHDATPQSSWYAYHCGKCLLIN